MDGPKRLQFTTVGPVGSEPKKLPSLKTYRFNLDLSDSTDSTCPEFFYTELLKPTPGAENKDAGKKDDKAKSGDPFGDEDDVEKLAAIAKSFEDKYNKPDGKKKKKKWQDNYYLTSLGEGYDENDTFIDNSEAYDEVLPETMTTKLGGFYINSGKLDLKEMSDVSSEDEFKSPMMKKSKKKRRISSDEDSDNEHKVVKKKKIKDTLSVDGEVKKKKKKKLIVPPGENSFKKPKIVKEKIKDKQPAKVISPTINGQNAVQNGVNSPSEISDSDDDSEFGKSNVSAVIDSVIAMASKDDSNSRSDLEEPKKVIDPESVPKLPPSLPAGMEGKVDQLKQHARASSDGKCKFFTGTVNKLLLEVEMISKQMKVSDRSAIFGHLAAFLPCSKDTLLKRAKSLRAKELEDKIKVPLEKLKQAINRVMPAIIEKFEEECKKAALERQEEGQKEVEGKKDSEGEKDGGRDTASDEEEEKTNQSDATKKRQTGPRKKFIWDGEIRSLLCDVVRVKMHTCQFSKTKSQSAEEFCKLFLEQDVRPLWPKGWMQARVLFKESKIAHCAWTNPQKPKKTMILTKIQGSGTPTNSLQLIKTSNSATAVTPGSANVAKIPSVSVSKITPSLATVKPIVTVHSVKNIVNAGKSVVHTPTQPVKKVIPTILDYASATSVERQKVANLTLTPQAVQRTNFTSPTPEIIKIDKKKLPGPSPKTSEQSWDHIVSDILRSSIAGPDTMRAKSPTKPQIQRQNSNPISSSPSTATNSYLAQFANFANAPMTLLQNQASTGRGSSDGAINLSTQNQKLLLQQQQQLESDRQRIKLLSEQQKSVEKLKLLQQQQSAGRGIITVSRSSLSQNQGVQRQSEVSKPSKTPTQSPMSLAMSKNITPGQGMSKTQLVNQFQQSKSMSQAEAFIRQQLNESNSSNSQGQVRSISSGKSGLGQPYPTSDRAGVVSSSTDTLRKTSPQTQTIRVSQASASQGKYTATPHAVSAQSSHAQSHGQLSHSQPTVTVTTNGRSATSLLKSLFGQAQAQSSPQIFPGPSPPLRSPTQVKPQISPQGHGQKQWSPGSSAKPSPSFMSTSTSPSKAYPMPVNARPVPGYQSVKLSNLTGDQMAAYQAAQQQLRQAAYGKPSPGPPVPHSPDPQQLQQQQHYNNLHHYGYPGYRDGSK